MSRTGHGGELKTSPGADQGRWLIRVDTGGTFTDGWARQPDGEERRCKVLSSGVLRGLIDECPQADQLRLARDLGAPDGVLRGFRLGENPVAGWDAGGRLLTLADPHGCRAGEVVELTSGEEAPVLAARILTGTAPGDRFPPMDVRVATTRGTNALLERKGADGAFLVTEGFEDLLAIRDQRRGDLFALRQQNPPPLFSRTIGLRERVAADGKVLRVLDEEHFSTVLAELVSEGVQVVAVALVHACAHPDHELRVRELLTAAGIAFVSLSHELSDRRHLLARAETTVANAYLDPVMAAFVARISEGLGEEEFDLMTSAGFLAPSSGYRPIDSLLSGPAGGAMGALASAAAGGRTRVLAFDMGGTSTDVSRIDGAPTYRHEQEIGPVRVLAPAVKIETVAAGGGSICQWRNGGLEVGPESAGADPGPASYGRGGPLTVTDVNLLLGCMDPDKAGIPLDQRAAEAALGALRRKMQDDGRAVPGDRALLEGLREIAVERMAEAIRKISVREGYDPGEFALVAFGGAGPQHACAVAEKLGVREIIVPGDAGLLSAWGLHRATREALASRQVLLELENCSTRFGPAFDDLEAEAREGLSTAAELRRWFVEVRLVGQDAGIELEYHRRPGLRKVCAEFAERYEQLYGYPVPTSRSVEIVAQRVLAAEPPPELPEETFGASAPVSGQREVLQDRFRTCVIDAGWARAEGTRGSLLLRRETDCSTGPATATSEEVRAELFRARFESVAEEMGALLQRTALSTNIKERLDFSCALLDREGRLVVNAPHIPVHLGALGLCVREVSRDRDWKEGDTVIVNHPGFGGSHLPDVTLVSPVFAGGKLLAFVANRAHHAEIGGLSPGSMPAAATCLAEEGVVLAPQFLFDGGADCFEAVQQQFLGADHPSRCVEDNMADLAAQAAANRHGVAALQALAKDHGAGEVRRQMENLYARAAAILRARLQGVGTTSCSGADVLDDGTPVQVGVRCDGERLTLDFTGSGDVHPGNLNAVPAIVRSAVLYVLRAWVDEPIPLNEGLLKEVEILIPPGLLNPPFTDDPTTCPAVVGGNVETSQRVVDVLLMALGLQANGQGTMNNILFGTEAFGYYETIGGGSGAGPGWDGMSGTHVHMSNTAITDPEILERRYPVRIRSFRRRTGSGGQGKWRGGEGLVREFEFLEPMTVSLLTQRRTVAPHGAGAGEDGQPGNQWLIDPDGREEPLEGITTLEIRPGQRIRIETPGGGGWGKG